jgi:hypothetical protein
MYFIDLQNAFELNAALMISIQSMRNKFSMPSMRLYRDISRAKGHPWHIGLSISMFLSTLNVVENFNTNHVHAK